MDIKWSEGEKSNLLQFLIESTKDATEKSSPYDLCMKYKAVNELSTPLLSIVDAVNALLFDLQNDHNDRIGRDTLVKMFQILDLTLPRDLKDDGVQEIEEEREVDQAVSAGPTSELQQNQISDGVRATERSADLDQKYRTIEDEMLNFLALKTETADSQMSIAGFLKEYKSAYNRKGTFAILTQIYACAKERILSTEYDNETKIRMLFISKTKLDRSDLERLRQDGIVEVTGKDFIISSYVSSDGQLMLGNRREMPRAAKKKEMEYHLGESDDDRNDSSDKDYAMSEDTENENSEENWVTGSGRNSAPPKCFDSNTRSTSSKNKKRSAKDNIAEESTETPMKKKKKAGLPRSTPLAVLTTATSSEPVRPDSPQSTSIFSSAVSSPCYPDLMEPTAQDFDTVIHPVSSFTATEPATPIIDQVTSKTQVISCDSAAEPSAQISSTSETVSSPIPTPQLLSATTPTLVIEQVTSEIPADLSAAELMASDASTAKQIYATLETDASIFPTPHPVSPTTPGNENIPPVPDKRNVTHVPSQQPTSLFDSISSIGRGDSMLFFSHNPNPPKNIEELEKRRKVRKLDQRVDDNVKDAEMTNAKEFLQNLHGLLRTVDSDIFSELQSKIEKSVANIGDDQKVSLKKLHSAFDTIYEMATP